MQDDQRERSVGEELPLPELGAQVIALAGDLAAAEARWLQMVAEFDRREGWVGVGVKSCAHWLSQRCGFGLKAAREKVRVARALSALPQVADAFERGELSYCRTRAITRVASPANEEELIELAKHSTGAQLDRIVRTTLGVKPRDDLAEPVSHRGVTWKWEDDGWLIFRARLDPVQGAALLAALDAAQSAHAADIQDAGRQCVAESSDNGQQAEAAHPPADGAASRAEPAWVTSAEATAAPGGPATAESDQPLGRAWADEDFGGERLEAGDFEGEPSEVEHSEGGAVEAVAQRGDNDEARTAAASTPWRRRAGSRADALAAIAEAYLGSQATGTGADLHSMPGPVRDGVRRHVDGGSVATVEMATRQTDDDLDLPRARTGRETGSERQDLGRRAASPAAPAALERTLAILRLRSTAHRGRLSPRGLGRGRSGRSGRPDPELPSLSWAAARSAVRVSTADDSQLAITSSDGGAASVMPESTASPRSRREGHRRTIARRAVETRPAAETASGAAIIAATQAGRRQLTSVERIPSRQDVHGPDPSEEPPSVE